MGLFVGFPVQPCYYCRNTHTVSKKTYFNSPILFKEVFMHSYKQKSMSTKYKFVDNKAVYFTTAAVVGWSDTRLPDGQEFTREMYKTILLDSIRHCQLNQGLKIHAWVLMTNHLHTICSCNEGKDLGLIWCNIKSFTAMKLIDALINNPKESRKEHLLHTFSAAGKKSSSNFKHKFWVT